MSRSSPIPEYEAALRREAAESCASASGVAPIRSISAVGAYRAVLGGNDIDSQRITALLKYLIRSGVPVDPGFEIDVVNFRDGRNFLQEKKETDLLMVCWIYRRQTRGTHQFSLYDDWRTASENRLSMMVSPNHSDGNWAARAVDAKARLVATYGDIEDVCSDTFGDRGFVHLFDTPSGMPDIDAEELVAPVPRHDDDRPDPWLGLCGDEAYLRHMQPALAARPTSLAARVNWLYGSDNPAANVSSIREKAASASTWSTMSIRAPG